MHQKRGKFEFLIPIVLVALLGACRGGEQGTAQQNGTSGQAGDAGSSTATDVTFVTSDDVDIAATWVTGEGEGPKPACLLVHMLGRDRTTYEAFQEVLASEGISSLAIDMRGHGGSTAGGTLDYRDFEQPQWESAKTDLVAGLDWLRMQPDVDPSGIGIVGASIGANLAVLVAADQLANAVENPPRFVVLLSPGLRYSLPLDPGVARALRSIHVFIASAMDDTQSFRGSQAISNASGGELHDFEGTDHGTELFDAHPELMNDIALWIKSSLSTEADESGEDLEDISEPASTGGGES